MKISIEYRLAFIALITISALTLSSRLGVFGHVVAIYTIWSSPNNRRKCSYGRELYQIIFIKLIVTALVLTLSIALELMYLSNTAVSNCSQSH